MGSNKHPNYNAEEIAFVQKLSDEGHTASETAALFSEEFGRMVSRNAIIGLWSRPSINRATRIIKPKPIAPPISFDFKTRTSKGRKTPEVVLARHKAAREAKEMRIRGSSIWKPLPGVEPVSLMDRASGACKWPVGALDSYGIEMFCGDLVKRDGCPYCEVHAFISYQEPRAR